MRPGGFVVLVAAVLAAGVSALAWETEGFRVVTTEGARRLAIEREPVPLPDVALVDQDGIRFSLADYRGKTVLVDFIYARCPTLCGVLGDDFQRLRALMPRAGAGGAVEFLSISFDRAHDDAAALKAYGDRYGAAPPLWRIAVPADDPGLRALLTSFGVVVIPDGLGGFVHDGALYVVDGRGRLTRVLDPGATPELLMPELLAAARGRPPS